MPALTEARLHIAHPGGAASRNLRGVGLARRLVGLLGAAPAPARRPGRADARPHVLARGALRDIVLCD